MQTMGFVDFGFVRSKFTWCNKRQRMKNLRERLDQGISKVPWQMVFLNAAVHHYPIINSDHVPLILYLFGNEQLAPKPFKFEMFSTREAFFFGVVAEA